MRYTTHRSRPGGLSLPRLLGLAVMLFGLCVTRAVGTEAAAGITGLHVVGNQIVNGSGQTVHLLGVNRSGTEYACAQGWGIFDGPHDATSVQAIASWHVNAVRIPLNEDCWLGINGIPSSYGGSTYQQAIADYVNLLNQAGIAAILELHWSAPGTTKATGQRAMPDADHSLTFWSQVASAYKSNSAVIFELFNEPYPDSNRDTTAAWQCLRDGGTCPGISYQAAGMQQLVTTIRQTGATNIISIPGVRYAGILSQWLSYKLSDPLGNITASWHNYNFATCVTASCWDSMVKPVLQQVPLIVSEIGENDCAHGYIDSLMPWLDSHGASYLGWTWDTWNCQSGPALISNYNGTPTNFGIGLRDHLAALAGTAPSPGPTATAVPPIATSAPATATALPASPTATKAAPTSTPVPPSATPIPPTSTPVALTIRLSLAHKKLRVHQVQTVRVSTAIGASIQITARFPGGTQKKFSRIAGGSGKLTWSYRQPSLARRTKHARVRVNAISSLGGQTRSSTATYLLAE